MVVMQAKGISKSFADKQILTDINLVLQEKERLGLVGVNGSGKTTLLKCLTGEIEPDEGEVIVSNSVSVAYLDQLPEYQEGMTAWDVIMTSFAHLIEKRKALRELERAMSEAEQGIEKIMEKYALLTEEYEKENGYACENIARRILAGLGFSDDDFAKPVSAFSGGQKTRLNLGRLLALNPDLLILDEPTNHLDMAAVEWLEDYLTSYRGTVLVVSHDRMFLDKITTRIAELLNHKIYSYPGNYSNYLKLKAENDLAWQRAYEKQQEYIQRTEEYIRRFKAGIKSKQARGRQAQLERLELIDKPVFRERIGEWDIKLDYESGQDVLRLSGICKSFGELRLFENVNLSLKKGDKVALIGPNGCGKTTLLKIITGAIEADTGEAIVGSRVKIGYFSQEFEDLNYNNSVLDEIIYNFDITKEKARTLLGRMLFTGDDVFKNVGALSGGEKSRLALLKLVMTGANFIILDEPTNHLDIESRQVIEDMLSDYPGTILIVSHDRYFIDQIVNGVAAIEDKKIKYYWGNYSYYHEKQSEMQEQKDKSNNRSVAVSEQQRLRIEQKDKQRLKRRLNNNLEKVEKEISKLEEKKVFLETLLAEPETYNSEEKAKEYTTEYGKVQNELAALYDEWEVLSVEIEEQCTEM